MLDPVDGPVDHHDRSSWTVGSRCVVRLDAGACAAAEHRQFLERLTGAAPFAVARVVGQDGPWLVTEPPVGIPADRLDQHPEPGALAGIIGTGLAALHALPVELLVAADADAVVGDAWDPIIERCRRSVEAGLVAPADLPAPYDRYPPERLLEMLIGPATDARADRGAASPVLCHGSPGAERFVTNGDCFVGFDRLETAVVADRHLDLAIAHLSVSELLGAEAVYAFYDAYGRDPDLASLDRAVLAARLLAPAAGSR